MRQLEKFKNLLKDKNKISLMHWASGLFNEKKQKIEFSNHFFLKDLYNCFSDTIIIKKSAQIGATTYSLLKAIWLAVYNNISIIYTMPKKSDISDFSQARINPIIRYNKIQADVDNVGLKKIGGSFLYLRGSWGETEAISVPADVLIHDEVDRSRPNILEMYSERLSASNLKWKLILSTPTIPKFGISDLFEESDKREWIVKCPEGHNQIIRESNIRDGKFVCLKCGKELDRTNGRWEAQRKSEITGFHITQLIAPWISAEEIIEKKKKYRFKQDYYNFVLGEEYEGGEGVVKRQDILSCIVGSEKIQTSGKTVAGVDWGNDSWVVIRRNNQIIYLAKITGDTRTHAKQVMEIADKFNAEIVADFGYGDTKNAELIEKYKKAVWMCVFSEGKLYPEFNEKRHIVNIDRKRIIEDTIIELKNREVEIIENELIPEFIEHYSNVIEVEKEDKNGKIKKVYERKGDDHLALANAYSKVLFLDKSKNIDFSGVSYTYGRETLNQNW